MPRPKQQPSSTPYQPTLNLRSRPGFSQASSSSEPLKKGKGKGEPLEKGEKGKKSLEKKQAPDELFGKEQRNGKDCALGKGQRAEHLEGPAQGGAHCGLAQHFGGPGLPARLQSRGLGKGHEGS